MKTSMDQKLKGILLMLYKQLDDLDFAVDLALLSNTNQQMQEKNIIIGNNSHTRGHTISRGKRKVSKVKAFNDTAHFKSRRWKRRKASFIFALHANTRRFK
ncbi:hypothetical protein DPMN_103229 [Dreissena polymorpha]|uniref:Uncharacterized protein n=1 Tax=Dreissena polymorpha TaxID=45954 RepID=A0A9D4H9F6_DREPO|nr:hypothetical protein DPMN_103229 [Dreissena polymorpha]